MNVVINCRCNNRPKLKLVKLLFCIFKKSWIKLNRKLHRVPRKNISTLMIFSQLKERSFTMRFSISRGCKIINRFQQSSDCSFWSSFVFWSIHIEKCVHCPAKFIDEGSCQVRRFGARRSGVRLLAGSYQDLVNWYCCLLTRRMVYGGAAVTTQNAKANRVKWYHTLCMLGRGVTRPLLL